MRMLTILGIEGFDVVVDVVDRLYCDYAQSICFSCTISLCGLGGMEGKCWLYGPGACTNRHAFVHISNTLLLRSTDIWV